MAAPTPATCRAAAIAIEMTLSGFFAVGIGAALGAWLRWIFGIVLNPLFGNILLGTLTANLVGGFLIGVAVEYFVHHDSIPPEWRLFVIVGFLGGLTTFSSFSAEAVELLSDENGHCSGAIFKDLDNHRYVVVAAKSVILATGGIGRLHIQGFPTSNHYGATGDGLCLSYRMGAKLAHIDTFQYHPSGAVYPEQLVGQLVTEGIRSEGGHLVNARGERFVNELDTRDVVSSSIIRECEEGRGIRTMSGRVGVWLDTPLLDAEHGPGTVEKHFPAMMLQAFFVLPRIHVVLGSGGHKPFDIERGDPQRSWRGSGNLQSQNRETKNYCVRYS